MDITAHVVSRIRPCSYVPSQSARMEFEIVGTMEPDDYLRRLQSGWRRFGRTLFRPRCLGCTKCRSLRVDASRFRLDRSMKRVRARNLDSLELTIQAASGLPDPEVLDLYDRYHLRQQELRGWPSHELDAPEDFQDAFLDNPIPTEQWLYRIDGRLIGAGFVDVLPGALSAIYFVYDHAILNRSPGTWNILRLLDRAAEQGRKHVYLGYFVAECRSLSYKARFRPNEVLNPDGTWIPFAR
ncbi:arginyltransferase [Tautonia rosea]|uniref:arginyltransferase n=1 Tax=Tautonia rosea TaxID=2728037 RepID=UPI0014755672|nr:arginyltransferase [Tautonia rosea]